MQSRRIKRAEEYEMRQPSALCVGDKGRNGWLSVKKVPRLAKRHVLGGSNVPDLTQLNLCIIIRVHLNSSVNTTTSILLRRAETIALFN